MTDIYKDRILDLQTAWKRYKRAQQPRKEAHRKVFEDLLMIPVERRDWTDEERDHVASLMRCVKGCNHKMVAAAMECSQEEAAALLSEMADAGEINPDYEDG